MKKLPIILIFLCVITQAQVLDLRTYKPISKDYYFIGDTLWISGRIIQPNNTIINKESGVSSIKFKGERNNIISTGLNCTVDGIEISSDSGGIAICAIMATVGGNLTVSNCNIHDVQWGIRCVADSNKFKQFDNYWIKIKNNWIHNTEDDGIFGQYFRNYEITDNTIFDVNNRYFTSDPGGGDGIQIAYWQDSVIIECNYIDHSKYGNKFCIIVGSTYRNPFKGYCRIKDNVLIARKYQDRILEDATTHTVLPNSVVYCKPMKIYEIEGNEIYNGSNGIFEQNGKEAVAMDIKNNFFSNQLECLVLNGSWSNFVQNNTFENGIESYISCSAVGDNITKNVFYSAPGLSITHYYNNKPAEWSALIDPKELKQGWGCNPGLVIKSNNLANVEIIHDTIPYYDTIQTPVYYDVPRYLDIYKVHNLDSIVAPILQEYFEKIQPKTYELKFY